MSAAPRLWKKSAASVPPVSLNSNHRFIIIAGPTGVGKSLFAAGLAQEAGGEIVGADAFQIYSGMAVLTAQPGAELTIRVPHHLVGAVPPSLSFGAAQYVAEAERAISEIALRGNVPVVTGGTGLYIKALAHGLDPVPTPDPDIRRELETLPLEALAVRLATLDPDAAPLLDMKNPRRVLRAIEICAQTGRPLAESRSRWREASAANYKGILLVRDRAELHERIRANVEAMFERGVVKEVRALGEVSSTASQAIGYRQIRGLIEGSLTRAECIEDIVIKTRQYAKRQLTWFRNQFSFTEINLTELQHPWEFTSEALRKLAWER